MLTVSPITVCVRPPRGAEHETATSPVLIADPEARPVRVRGARPAPAASWSASAGAGRALGVVGLVAARVEGDHQRVADEPVDLAAVLLDHRRDRDLEVGVQHRRDLVRVVPLGEAS